MLFRDIIMESEYDPLADAAARNVKTTVFGKDDPSRRATHRKKEEDTIMGQLTEGFRVKDMLAPTYWGEGIIDATPFGHFTSTHGHNDTETDTVRKVNKNQTSNLPLGQFNVVNDSCYTDQEFGLGKGKRTVFENPYRVDAALVEKKDYQEPIIFNQQ